MGLGHTSIPKGHIEANETIEECVKREIREELSLEINLDMNFSHLITYSPSNGILKDVTFYVSTITGGDIKVDNKEVIDTVWLKYEDAINALTYESDKEVLEDAIEDPELHIDTDEKINNIKKEINKIVDDRLNKHAQKLQHLIL